MKRRVAKQPFMCYNLFNHKQLGAHMHSTVFYQEGQLYLNLSVPLDLNFHNPLEALRRLFWSLDYGCFKREKKVSGRLMLSPRGKWCSFWFMHVCTGVSAVEKWKPYVNEISFVSMYWKVGRHPIIVPSIVSSAPTEMLSGIFSLRV
jgi:hypothetical protein